MTPQLKLTYFQPPGRAEITRLVLSYGQIPFEDERLQWPEFLVLKPTLPLGQMPILTVDDRVFVQSIAIARYAAKLCGLYPQDPLQALRVDMVVDTIIDARNVWRDFRIDTDKARQADKIQQFLDVTVPFTLGALESMIKSEFFLDAMTLADVALFDHIENNIKVTCPEFKLEAFPRVNKIYHDVKTHPNIAEYLANHGSS